MANFSIQAVQTEVNWNSVSVCLVIKHAILVKLISTKTKMSLNDGFGNGSKTVQANII